MGAFVNKIRAIMGLEPKRDKTLTGKVPNEVMIHRPMQEAVKGNPVVFAPARMNPPTAAHRLIIDTALQAAREHDAPHHIILTRTHDIVKKKTGAGIRNPLTPEQKLKHARRFFPDANVQLADKDKPNLLSQLSDLHARGHDHVIMVAGSDRIPEYKRLIDTYNGKSGPHGHFNFKKVTYRSAGERDPDAEGPAGWSATKSRQTAEAGDYKTFKKNAVPGHLHDLHAKELYDDLRGGMGINEDVGFNMAGNPVPAIPTKAARDIQGKKSPLTDTPPPGKKGNIGYDSDLDDGSDKTRANLARRRSMKRWVATQAFEGLDQISGDMDQSPTSYPVTTTPVPTAKPRIKSFKASMKEGLFSDTNVPGEQGSPTYGSDINTSSDSNTINITKKAKKLKEDKPCWKNYEMVGMKKGKKGRPVPNCVPKKVEEGADARDIRGDDDEDAAYRGDLLKRGTRVILRKPGYEGTKGNIDHYDRNTRSYVVSIDASGSNMVVKADELLALQNPNDKPMQETFIDEMSDQKLLKYIQAAGKDYFSNEKTKKKRGAGIDLAAHKIAKHAGVSVSEERKPYVKPHYGDSSKPTIQTAWKASNKHGKVKYFGLDFKKSAKRHAGIVSESLVEQVKAIMERGEDSKGLYRPTEKGAGLTRKGAKHFGIKTAVTTPPSKLKKGSTAWNRRKSFCARMGGMKGPMRDEKGRPTRKAMSLRRWNCEETEGENL